MWQQLIEHLSQGPAVRRQPRLILTGETHILQRHRQRRSILVLWALIFDQVLQAGHRCPKTIVVEYLAREEWHVINPSGRRCQVPAGSSVRSFRVECDAAVAVP